MGKLTVFTFISLNGYYKGPGEDISWHKHGKEENEYASESLRNSHTLLFGRITYDMMAAYWPTPMAAQNDPDIAEGMNAAPKIVFSKTMKSASWRNTEVIGGTIVESIRKRKETPENMTILGSGSIVSLFSEHGLIDEYHIIVDPVAIREGTPLLQKINHQVDLVLTGTRTFKSGAVLLSYKV